MFFAAAANAANPTVNVVLKNDVLTGNNLEFDVYAQSSSPLELAGAGLAFQFNTSALNGGTVTASIVSSSSALSNSAQVPASGVVIINGDTTIVVFPAAVPPGSGSGSSIANSTPGTKLYRVRLTNSTSWTQTGRNFITAASAWQYPTSFTAYVSGQNTSVWTGSSVSNQFTGNVLPVELTAFSAAAKGRSVNLVWTTASEKNTYEFVIERSLLNSNWEKIASVRAAGNSNTVRNYNYNDESLQSGLYSYRLKMIDIDGSFEYSKTLSAEVNVPKEFTLSKNYPNPFNPSTKIDYALPSDAVVSLEVFNIAGEKVSTLVNEKQSAGYYTVQFNAEKHPSGFYICRLYTTDEKTGKTISLFTKMLLLK